MEENSAPQRQEMPPANSSTPEWNFYWSPPIQMKAKPSYPPTRQPTKAAPTKQETLISLEKLPMKAKQATETLIDLGGTELAEGISKTLLKKVYRRLAKRLHPDAGMNVPAGSFLELKRAYEIVQRALPALTSSDSTCDNGSASAQAYRRPAAA